VQVGVRSEHGKYVNTEAHMPRSWRGLTLDTNTHPGEEQKVPGRRAQPVQAEVAPPPPRALAIAAGLTLLSRMLILFPLALHLREVMAPTPGTSSARFLQLQCTFASLWEQRRRISVQAEVSF
jgi:hypothetical protein